MSENNFKTKKALWFPPRALVLLSIIGLLCVWSVLSIMNSRNQKNGGYTAYLYQDGELYTSIDLSEIKEEQTISIVTGDGGYNTILVRPGAIAVTDANCPDKVCVHMGLVRTKSIPIVCLPHKLVIELRENNAKRPDAISY